MMQGSLAMLLGTAAAICLAAGGLALIVRARSFAVRLLIAGVGLSIGAALSPSSPEAPPTMGLLDVFAALAAAAGVISLLGSRRRLGMALIWPALARWAIWPLLKPYVMANWVLIALVVAPFSLFVLIWVLQQILRPIYGDHAAGRVAGDYLVRTIDGAGRLLGWLISLPLRLLSRTTGRS